MKGLAPRCRLIFSKICSLDSWWECSSQFKVRELGSKRCKSVWSLSVMHILRKLFSQYARTSNKELKRNSVRQLIAVNSMWLISYLFLVHLGAICSWISIHRCLSSSYLFVNHQAVVHLQRRTVILQPIHTLLQQLFVPHWLNHSNHSQAPNEVLFIPFIGAYLAPVVMWLNWLPSSYLLPITYLWHSIHTLLQQLFEPNELHHASASLINLQIAQQLSVFYASLHSQAPNEVLFIQMLYSRCKQLLFPIQWLPSSYQLCANAPAQMGCNNEASFLSFGCLAAITTLKLCSSRSKLLIGHWLNYS